MAKIGVQIELEGAPQYKENMANLTAQTKLYQAQVKRLSSEMNSGISAFQKSITESKALTQQLEAQKNQSKLLSEQIAKASEQYGEDSTKVIRLKTQYENLQKAIADTTQALEANGGMAGAIGAQFEEVGNKMQAVGDKISSIGQTLTTRISAPIAAVGAASVKAFADWESAFAGVMKTVDETATTTYEDLAEGIKKMATETASSKEEIAAVAEAAGQLGVGADDLLKFTRTMIELGDSTNLSSEEAAVALARISNITGDSMQDVDKLGASIVALGNNFATNESAIVEMSNRLASAGKIAGLSTTDILALSTAMSSVGIEAEAGGTAMTQTLTAISKAASEGGAKLSTLAQVSGMTADEFVTSWKTAPTATLQAFIQGLSDMNAAGQDTYAVLDELGMSGIRQSNMLQSLALASDQLAGAVEVSNKAYAENTALSDEAAKRYATFNAQVSQTKERISNLGIQIGEILMPYVIKVIDKIQELADKFANLDPKTQETIVKIAALVAAIGPLMTVGGKLISGIGTMSTTIGQIVSKIGPMISSLGLAAPEILLIVAAIGALVAVFTTLFKNNEDFRNSVLQIWGEVQAFISATCEQIKSIFSGFVEIANELWAIFGDEIMLRVQTAFTIVQTVISTVLTVIQQTINLVLAVIRGDWSSAWTAITNIFSTLLNAIKTIASSVLNMIIGVINERLERIKNLFTNIKNTITSIFSNLLSSAANWGKDFVQNFCDGITEKFEALKSKVSSMADTIRSYLHFSTPDVGPLKDADKWPKDFVQQYAQGIENARYLIKGAVEDVAADVAVLANPFDSEEMYSAVRAGASDATLRIAIGDRELGRALRDMGVVFNG